MKLLKPDWISHGGKPIFSVDIHPDGSRCATGGQGDNAGRVSVWNMEPLRCEEAESDSSIPRMIWTMDHHLGCVNCVRWSPDGRYLASAGDDKLVMISQCSNGTPPVFGCREEWRVTTFLRGHYEDVLDIAWSDNQLYLASCSVDNHVIVWNAQHFPEQVAVLKGHSGLVKGVAWDPIGRYLASQADDKSLRIWRTSDWKEERSITKPFEECGGTTHVLRLHWSPDGNYLVSAHAMNNSGPTAQIIDPQDWNTNLDFVGHRKAITCVRFSPKICSRLLKKKENKESMCHNYTCCAIGSRDRSVSIWLTALRRPLVIMTDLFTSSVLDLSWSHDGLELLCCSHDGTVAFFMFSKDEIGEPFTDQEQMTFKQTMFGEVYTKSLSRPESNSFRQRDEQPMPTLIKNSGQASINKQIEVRTKDGKRRIYPIFLASQTDLNQGNVQCNEGPMFSSTKETSQIVREIKNDNADRSLLVESIHTPVDRGFISASQKTDNPRTTADYFSSPIAREHLLSASRAIASKKKLDIREDGIKKKDRRGRPRKLPADNVSSVMSKQLSQQTTMVYSDKGLGLFEAALPLPHSVQVPDSHQMVEVLEENLGDLKVYELRSVMKANILWNRAFCAKPCALSVDAVVTAVACTDCTLHWLSTISGRLIGPTLTMDSAVHWLQCKKDHCLVVTTRGTLSVWNTSTLQCLLSRESVAPIVPDSSVEIVQCSLTDQGCPLIMVSNDTTYTFSPSLKAWLRIHNSKDAFLSLSTHQGVGLPQGGPLADLQGQISISKVNTVAANWLQVASMQHAEMQIASSLALKSPEEYQFWLRTYVMYLIDIGCITPLQEILDNLHSPSLCRDDTILGIPKKLLLSELLPLLSKNSNLTEISKRYEGHVIK